MMKALLSALVGLAGLVCNSPASAEDYTPNLEGTWIGSEGEAIFADGTVTNLDEHVMSFEVVISDQQGSVFKAVQTVKPKGDAKLGSHGEETLTGQSFHRIGAVTATGPFVVMVDVDDTTTTGCRLINEDAMRCVESEPGANAFAATVLLKRQ